MAIDPSSRFAEYLDQGTQNLRNYLEGSVISKNSRELERLEAYHLYWKFYDGNHYKDFNHAMISFNYVKAFIDKINQFLLGETGCTFKVVSLYDDNIDPEIARPIEEIILYNWRRNNKSITLAKMLQMGSVTGDVWVMGTWDIKKKYVKLTVLDSRQVFPVFNNGNYEDLAGVQVRQVLETQPELITKSKKQLRLKVTYYQKDVVETWYQESTELITPQADIYNQSFKNDVEGYSKQDNPLGYIPIVHIKNRPSSNSYFGKSDANDILKLNKVYNEMNQEMKGIIDYYSTPTTVVTGATLKNMTRGLGKIWSGLPPEANVFTLGLDADLGSMTTYLATIKQGMHEISDVPEQVLGKIQNFSGTSAAALKLTFQPLVQQADNKALTYGEGVAEINDLILRLMFKYDKNNKRLQELEYDENGEMRVEAIWSYGFPSDRMNILQEAQYEMQLGIGLREDVLNRLGTNNVETFLEKVDAEAIHNAEIQSEVIKLTTPVAPVDPNADPNAES